MILTSLGLRKPEASDSYDVGDFNFNADTLDGLLVAQAAILTAAQQYKLTANTGYALRDATDINGEINAGIYSVTLASTNRPAGIGLLHVIRRDATNIFQNMFATETGIIYSRASTNSGSSWSTWRQAASAAEVALKLDIASYTAADVLTKIKTVDGSGSGLDADLFQGNAPSHFALAGHNHTLDSLSNLTIAAKAINDILQWNGTAWVNRTLVAAGIAAAVHTHTISDVSTLQTQLDGKQATITGGASSITSSNLTASRALASDGSGKVSVSAVTLTELGHLSGVTSAIQTQLNAKQATITGAATTVASANLTFNRALISDGTGKITVGSATDTELGYLSGVTSAIQTQLNAKQATITGGATSITGSNLTINRALLSDGSGKVGVSAVTATELGYLAGVTSAIQTQINGKQATIAVTANRALVSDIGGAVGASAVTSTELGYLAGVTSAIQTQLNSKEATITGAATTITGSNLTANRAMVSDVSGKVAISAVTATELGYLSGVTSAIQTQLNAKQETITGSATSIVSSNLTASRAVVSDGSGKIAASAATSTEVGYLSGVTSAIQTQLNAKLGTTAKAADSSKIDGRTIFVQSATPTGVDGDIWFKPA